MIINNYKLLGIFVFCFMFISCDCTSQRDKSAIEELRQRYCNFNGYLKNKEDSKVGERWEEEFKMLEHPTDYPTFEAMSDILSIFVTLPEDLIKNCPVLKNYLSALVKYHANNTKIKQIEVNRAISCIFKKLQQIREETASK
jgi:hypothetical protein